MLMVDYLKYAKQYYGTGTKSELQNKNLARNKPWDPLQSSPWTPRGRSLHATSARHASATIRGWVRTGFMTRESVGDSLFGHRGLGLLAHE